MNQRKFKNRNKINQSRTIAQKLNDSHVKYASVKIEGVDTIVGREGHLNIVDDKDFELVFDYFNGECSKNEIIRC